MKPSAIRFWACTAAAVCLIMMLVLSIHMYFAYGVKVNITALVMAEILGGLLIWIFSYGATPGFGPGADADLDDLN